MFAVCGVPDDKFRTICSTVDKLDKVWRLTAVHILSFSVPDSIIQILTLTWDSCSLTEGLGRCVDGVNYCYEGQTFRLNLHRLWLVSCCPLSTLLCSLSPSLYHSSISGFDPFPHAIFSCPNLDALGGREEGDGEWEGLVRGGCRPDWGVRQYAGWDFPQIHTGHQWHSSVQSTATPTSVNCPQNSSSVSSRDSRQTRTTVHLHIFILHLLKHCTQVVYSKSTFIPLHLFYSYSY